jgi:hypothetical protein
VAKLTGDFTRTAGICANYGIGEKYVRCATAAGDQQLQRGRTLKITDATFDQHAQNAGELRSLNVWSPAIGIAPEQMQGSGNV